MGLELGAQLEVVLGAELEALRCMAVLSVEEAVAVAGRGAGAGLSALEAEHQAAEHQAAERQVVEEWVSEEEELVT